MLRQAKGSTPDQGPAIPETDTVALHRAFLDTIDSQGITADRLKKIHAHITTASLVLYLMSLGFLAITGYAFISGFGTVMGLPVFAIVFMLSSTGAFVRAWGLAFRSWQIEHARLGGVRSFVASWALWIPWYVSAKDIERSILGARSLTHSKTVSSTTGMPSMAEDTPHE
ncbi:hypothetical protein [Alcanivorax sp. 1008]|uniref:hypothetical protein n=1 Tax=Alcanivorax sp. 1008 TaxID=2816853 RepID=UPI001DF0BD5F|nr:hypothetical protein [Alcanivorax sp. 1008]MCC1496737.1 hypothetical protein [Alcanivorax sp. 1008]